jgi:YhcH/YjgK/YiaL family protein
MASYSREYTQLPIVALNSDVESRRMIVDRIENYTKYLNLPSGIVRAIEYIGSTDFTHVENGQYELDGKKLVSIVMRYKTKQDEQAIWESHRKYIDVQFIASGIERCGYVPLVSAPPVKTPYNEEKDVIFYEPGTEMFEAPMGTFMIFYPDDIHAPSLAAGKPPVSSDVVKVVVKVAV